MYQMYLNLTCQVQRVYNIKTSYITYNYLFLFENFPIIVNKYVTREHMAVCVS